MSKKLKKIEKFFEKIEKFFFHKINSHYHIWIVPTSGVTQITMQGSRDQNLRGGGHSPYKVGLNHWFTRRVVKHKNYSISPELLACPYWLVTCYYHELCHQKLRHEKSWASWPLYELCFGNFNFSKEYQH